MTKQTNIIKSFSEHLFWDVNRDEIVINIHSKYIINSVLQYGLYNDWKILVKIFQLKKIVEIASKNKHLDHKTASFIALISNTASNKFICFSTKQSTRAHWSF